MLNLYQIRNSLNRLAETTDQVDVLSREIANCFMERLSIIRLQPKCILDCGARTGYLSQKLVHHYSDAALIALDFSDKQLVQMPNTICLKTAAHYTTLPLKNNSVDMIVSSLSLNWSNDLAACFREFRRILKPNGLFMFALLGVETLKELRESFIACHEYLYRFPDMHDVGDLLVQTGFENPVMEMENLTVCYKQLVTLFNDLKSAGAGNAHQKRPKGLFGKKRWNDAIKKYESFKNNNTYPATFEIIYGHAWQPEREEEQPLVSESVIHF